MFFNKFKNRKYFLLREKEAVTELIAKADIDIHILEALDPNIKVGERQLSKNGSFQDIKAVDLLKDVQEQQDRNLAKLKAINKLL